MRNALYSLAEMSISVGIVIGMALIVLFGNFPTH